MAKAICISCGAPKREPWQKCRNCAFDPSKDNAELVKSVYLSISRFEDEQTQRQYASELDQIGDEIRKGHAVQYDKSEIARLEEQRQLVKSVPASAVWDAVFRFFLPGIVFIAFLICLFILLSLLMKRG